MIFIESRTVKLYVLYNGVLDTSSVEVFVNTNAPDEIIKSVCNDIKNDKILKRCDALDGIVNVLKARGYECDIANFIPAFGFRED